jgi:hypothetical protein
MPAFESFFPEDYPDFEEFGTPPCATSDPDSFFSEDHPDGMKHIRPIYRYEREAKQICLECPYMQRCLQFALDNPDVQGIWGATTEQQRIKIRKGIPVSIALPSSKHR